MAVMTAANEPRRPTNHLLKRKVTRMARWMASSPFANSLLKKISSGTKRQLTVHLYKNAREKSKAPARYSQGYSRKNGRPRRPCRTMMIVTCPRAASRPLVLHATTMIPGRYSRFDILMDRAPLDSASVSLGVGLLLHVMERTRKGSTQSPGTRCRRQGWRLGRRQPPSNH